MNRPKRVDADSFKEKIDNLPEGELDRINQLQHEHTVNEYNNFVEHYKKDECYLCNKPFKTISSNYPCIHWLLRSCKFKSKDFSKVYEKYDYHQITSFLRWVANQERFQGNINDLDDEKGDNKIFETTIKWKNIEWTFNCSGNDYLGHIGSNSNYPHYHFQMRIDRKPFINFNQHHIPFSDKDLFNLDLIQQKPEVINHSFGAGGSGMQDAVNIDPNDIIQYTTSTDNEDDATYHMQTMIMAKDISNPISGDDVYEMIKESQKTRKPFASLADKHLGDNANITTVVSPVDTIPDIAKRSGRKRS